MRVEWGGVRVLEFRERLEGVATRPREGGPVGHPGVPPGDHQGIARTLLGLFTDFLPIFYLIMSLLLAHVSMFMFVVMSMFTFRSSTGLNVAVEPRQKTIMNPPSNKREGGGCPRILSDPGGRIVVLVVLVK